MILGNDWRTFENFSLQSVHGVIWEVYSHENVYLVYRYHVDDKDEDMPVPKVYYSKRNGDVHHQDLEWYSEGFYDAIHDGKSVFTIIDA